MTQYQNQVVENLINAKNSSKKNLFTDIYVYQDGENILSELVLEAVAALGEGFVVDICKNALEAKLHGKKSYISEKQAWCIVYAFVKISDKALVEWYSNYCAEAQAEEQNSELFVVKTASSNNYMNLHSSNEKEFSTTSFQEAIAVFNKEVEVLNDYYVTADSLPYSPSDKEYANAVVCEIFKIAEGEIESIESSPYFFEK